MRLLMPWFRHSCSPLSTARASINSGWLTAFLTTLVAKSVSPRWFQTITPILAFTRLKKIASSTLILRTLSGGGSHFSFRWAIGFLTLVADWWLTKMDRALSNTSIGSKVFPSCTLVFRWPHLLHAQQ